MNVNESNETKDNNENQKFSNLVNILKSQQPVQVPINKKVYNALKLTYPSDLHHTIPTHLTIPPNKAIITFNRDVKKFKTISPKTYKAPSVSLPEYWANFDAKVSNYASQVTKPQNQQKCGSCFAFAAATTINDVFIFGKKLNYNPDISPLSILSCIKNRSCNLQCDGGDSLCILDDISNQGVTTNYCMNYDKFCNNSKLCYTPEKKPFDEKDQKDDDEEKIPECGCCPNCENNYSYYISKPTLVSKVSAKNIEGHPDAEEIIKNHIFNYGAVVTGYVVYSNFVKDESNGKFEKTRGIYIETEKYAQDKNVNPKTFMGCHAVSIVGWGIEKNPITLDDGTVLNTTPYWIVRNSWGSLWGNNGYFKIAMSRKINEREINKDTSLEKINIVNIGGQTYQMGGAILFTPSDIRKYDKNRKICYDNGLCNEKSPYETPSPSSPSPSPSPFSPFSSKSSETTKKSSFINYFLFFIILVAVFFFIYKIYKKYKQNINETIINI